MTRSIWIWILALLLAPAPAGAISTEEVLGNDVELSVRDAVLLALENNLELEVARMNPAIADEGLRRALGSYDPTFLANWSFADDEDPVANAVQAFFGGGAGGALTPIVPEGLIESKTWAYETGFEGILPYGVSYSTTVDVTRTESNSGFFQLDPQWRSDWQSSLVLPLLKGFLQSEADVQVKRSRIQDNISLEDFRTDLLDEVQLVDKAYWTLTALIDGTRVAEKSLDTANGILERTRVQYEVGVVSKVKIVQAVSGAAEREATAIERRADSRTAEDNLVGLILAPEAFGFTTTRIRPESPRHIEYEVNEERAVELALATRPEVARARGQLEDAEVQLAFAENQRLPKLDMVGTYAQHGISGKAKDGVDASVTPPVSFPRKFTGSSSSGGSYRDFLSGDTSRSWSIAAQFSVPVPNTAARAHATQRRIEKRRSNTRLRQTEQAVILDTRKSARELKAALEVIKARQRGQEAAAEALRAEEEKLRLGDSTPFTVLEFEEDLTEAENGLILALRRYRDSITALEKAQGTLLRSRGIRFEEEVAR